MTERIPIDKYCEKKISTLPTTYEGLIDYVDISSVNNIEKEIVSYQTISSKDAPSRAKQLLKRGDILVSTVRPNLNAVALIKSETENLMVGSTGYCVLRCKENADARYLFHFCQSPYFVDDMSSQATGASYPAVSNSIVRSSLIPCYSVEEQRKIADKMDALCGLIKLRKKQLLKLDELVKSRFIELFDGKGYPTRKWNEVFNTTTGKLDSNAMVENGEYPFFTCAKEVFRIDKYAFDQEALLLAGNNAAGKYDVKYYKGKFNAYQRTYVLGLKEDWSYQLFRYQLEDKLVYLQQQSLGGLTKYLTLKILGELEFVVPPMDKQNEFTAFVEQVDKSKLAIQKSLEKLETLKKSLMQKYFG